MPDETAAPILDVRPDLAAGQEPFSRILRAAEDTPRGGAFVLLAPFEPVPLFGVLEKLGFSYESRPAGAEGFRVVFTRDRPR